MTTEDKDRKKLSLSSGGTLSLGKTIETSQVKQSFSHGRSKTVQVERRRKRVAIVSNDMKDVEAVDENAPQNLTSEERAARTRALQVGLKQTDGTSEEVSSPHAKLILSEQGLSGDGERTAITVFPEPTEKAGKELDRREVELKEAQRIEEEERQIKILEAARLAEEEESRLAKGASPRQANRSNDKELEIDDEAEIEPDDGSNESKPGKKRGDPNKKLTVPVSRRGEPRRRHSGKLTISQALDDTGIERVRSLA